MALTIQHRRGTAAAWTTANPVLAAGEPGMETDTGKEKLGDGVTAWADLPYLLDEATADAAFGDEEGLLRHWTSGAIDTALTAAQATGKPVVLPEGTFDLTNSFAPISGKIRGVPGKTIIRTDGRTAFRADDVDLELQDLVIDLSADTAANDGTPTTTQIGVDIRAVTAAGCSLTCKGVEVRNAHGNGIRVSSPDPTYRCEVSIADDCEIHDVYFGVYILRPTHCRVVMNDVHDCEYGIMAIGNIAAPSDNNTIIGFNDVYDCVVQGVISNQALQNFGIVGNVVTACGVGNAVGWGIVTSEASSIFTVSGNVVDGCAGGITIDLRKSTGDVFEHAQGSVTGNTCINSTRATSGHGINANYVNGLTVAGNICRGNAGHGIAITATRCHIGGNTSVDNTRSGLTLNQVAGTPTGQHTLGINTLAGNGEADFVNTTLDSTTILRGNQVMVLSPLVDQQTTGGPSRMRASRMDTTIAAGDILGSLDFFSNDASFPGASVLARVEGRQSLGSPSAGDLALMVHNGSSLADALLIDRRGYQFIPNARTVPAENPVGGAFTYTEGGVFKARSSGGALFNTTQQAANPDTSGATLAALETEVNELKAVLRTAGLIAT